MTHTQLCINHLKLPEDIQSIIKDFTLYDVKTAKMRSIKKVIHNEINTAECSSTIEFYTDIPFYPQHWWFGTDDGKIQFQANFCSSCGNYVINSSGGLTIRIFCYCYQD